MYNKIINPKTGRSVSINGKIGKLTIRKYLDYFIGGTSKHDIPMNNYESLKDLSYEEFERQIEKLYSNVEILSIDSFKTEDIDEKLNSFGFNIKRITAPGVTASYLEGGIFTDENGNIIKMMNCPWDIPPKGPEFWPAECREIFFKREIYSMVNLYKMGLSPEFISIEFVKLEFDGKVNLYGLAKLKKHKTFREFYDEEFNNSDLDIEDNISKNKNVKSMFDKLLERANSLNLYIMEDLHLNNLVMNLTNDELLLIDTIPIEQTKKLNTMDKILWEFA